MSKLNETLADLISDSGLNHKETAEKIGTSQACMTYYMQGQREPTVENLIKFADYYNCSTDYLLGREAENKRLTFKTCPPFSQQLAFLKKHFSCSANRFYTGTKISKSAYYSWLRGTHKPSLGNVIELADEFGCRVDFILGREN